MQWRAKTVQAATLSSMVFLNRGAKFEASPLPVEAQFAPAFSPASRTLMATVAGCFSEPEFFWLAPDMPRLDGGQGLLLKGNGRGGFEAIPGRQSGLVINGEQRGAAFADFDQDGRVDLGVSQNGTETLLYRNQRGDAGLRISPERSTRKSEWHRGAAPAENRQHPSARPSKFKAAQAIGRKTVR